MIQNKTIPSSREKIIVILGPTASGKSDLAIYLARIFHGEIISADSRQVYRGMDIGSGKVTKKEQRLAKHWMLDIASPNTNFNVSKFQKSTQKIIRDILRRGKIPIICGGTGFWIKSIVDEVGFPEVKPDWKLREKLQSKSADSLFKILSQMDPSRAKSIDRWNKVRLIRAIEICKSLGKVPESKSDSDSSGYEFLQLGIKFPKEILDKRIELRLKERFKQGMIAEARNLHFKNNVSWKRLESFGLEYRWIARFIQGHISLAEMKEKLFQDIKNYAKRQTTWFKKDTRIVWLASRDQFEKQVKKFLK